MRKTALRVPVADRREPTVITLSFRDDPADFSPAAVTVGYARWRMPTEMPVYRPRGEDPRIDAAHNQWDEREEQVMRDVLGETLGWVRGCCDPAPTDITWTRVGGRFAAGCALTRDGHPVDLAIAEPGR
jgi:hypothetical protein